MQDVVAAGTAESVEQPFFLNFEVTAVAWGRIWPFWASLSPLRGLTVPVNFISDTTAGSRKKTSSTRDCWLRSIRSECPDWDVNTPICL